MKTFRITLEDDVEAVIYKAKGIAEKYGASFEGNTDTGSFNSNGVEGNYKITRNAEDTKNIINIQITKKPLVIPWQLVNATLSSFFGGSINDAAGAHKVTSKNDADSEAKTTKDKKVSVSGSVNGNVTATGNVSGYVTGNASDAKPTAEEKATDATQKTTSQETSNAESSSSESSDTKNNQDGIGGLSGINWRFFQNDKKPVSSPKPKDDVVDAEFTDAKDAANTPEGQAKTDRRTKAQEIIQSHILWAAGSGFIPIPFADMAALTALQVGMLEQLASVYGIKTSQATGKGFIKALTGTGVAKLAAQYGASLLKTIPGFGTVAGGVAMSIAGGASTYALGQVVMEQFENERDLDSIDLEEAKAKYSEAYEEGKDITEKIKKEEFKQAQEEEVFSDLGSSSDVKVTPVASPTSTDVQEEDIFAKIEKLGNLKDKGLISSDEFEAQKTKLLDRL